ncbi:MAG: beta strand repeat-containing protein, partial [Bacteroidota bacterium]
TVYGTELYVNDNSTGGDVYTTAVGNDNNPGTASAPFATITKAITVAQAGNTIKVDAGTYAENITINKALNVLGSNEAVSPNTGTRVAEAIIVPASTNTSTGAVVTITNSNVQFRGFTVDGDNTTLASSGVGLGGSLGTSIDAARTIFLNANGVSNISITNNITKNAVNGIRIEQTTNYFATTAGALRSTNILLDNNKVQDMTGTGIRLGNSMYAKVTNNTVTNADNGIGFSSFRISDAGSAADRVIANNTISSRYAGIWVNLYHASPYALNNNTITVAPAATSMAPTPQARTAWYGIMYSTVSAPQNFTNQVSLPQVSTPEWWTATGNTIDGAALEATSTGHGYWLYYVDNNRDNLGVDHYGQISGGSVSNVDVGIMLKNRDTDPATNFGTSAVGAHANVSGTSFSLRNGGTGLRLIDDATWTTANPAPLVNKRTVALGIGSGVSISGGAKGLHVSHPVAGTANYTAYSSITGGDVNNIAFTGQTGNYMQLDNHGNNLSALSASFDGQTGATATLSQNYSIEDKVYHKTDNAASGFVRVKADNVFVTNNSGSIQRGVEAATANNTINVDAGSYSDNISISGKDGLLIKGPNAGLNNANGTRVAEAVVTSASATTSLFAIASNVSSYTIDGFRLVGADYTSPSSAPNQGNIIWASGATVSNILNNILEISSSSTGTKRYVWLGGSSATLSGGDYISGNISHNSFTASGTGLGFAGITTQLWSQNLNITGNKFAGMKGQRNLLMNGPTATVVISNKEFFTSDDAGARELIRFEAGSPSVMSGGATIQNNSFSIAGTGKAFSTSSAVNYGANISVTNNDFTNVGGASINHGGTGTIAATCNWWGQLCGPVSGDIVGTATSTAWTTDGTDSNPAMGFQPNANTCFGGTAVVATGTQVNITSCYGDSNGSIDLTVSGGIAPYTYAWSNAANTEDISGLAAGTYSVTVTDVCGATVNQGTASFTITQPTQITGSGAVTSNYNGSQISCNGVSDGTITVTATGGTGTLSYSIDGGSYQASNVFTGLAAGVHTLSVKDANNCVVSLSSVTITAPAAISGSGAVTSNYNGSELSCATSTDGAITVTANGGTGSLQYSLNGGAYQAGNVFSGLAAGTYAVSVKDANNCTFAAGNVTITAPAAISGSGVVTSNYNGSQLSCATSTDGAITVTATGGTGSLQYSLNGGSYQAGNVFSGLAAGTYAVSVKDANNCTF